MLSCSALPIPFVPISDRVCVRVCVRAVMLRFYLRIVFFGLAYVTLKFQYVIFPFLLPSVAAAAAAAPAAAEKARLP